MAPRRVICVVANKTSEAYCANLVFSIRKSGCRLPICLIPFGGKPVRLPSLLREVEQVDVSKFPDPAGLFLNELGQLLNQCPNGFLRRFLAFFGDWDEFIYSDNDVVALMNWERLFDYLPGHELVHADKEYTTKGRYNHRKPEEVERLFGQGANEKAITAGHFVCRRSAKQVQDLRAAIDWFREHPEVPLRHDQALLHIAALIGNWQTLNLCKPSHSWLSSWAGDYQTSLEVIQQVQERNGPRISHLHYSGGKPSGSKAIEEFLLSSLGDGTRLRKQVMDGTRAITGWNQLRHVNRRVSRKIWKILSNG